MSKESIKNRMQELGLTNSKEWNIYKKLFNGVSFSLDDVNTQSCEQVYVKFAKFLAEQEKPSIWKDPRNELPEYDCFPVDVCLYYSKEDNIRQGVERYSSGTYEEDYGFTASDWTTDKLATDMNVLPTKWCYTEELCEKDLLKQAGEE